MKYIIILATLLASCGDDEPRPPPGPSTDPLCKGRTLGERYCLTEVIMVDCLHPVRVLDCGECIQTAAGIDTEYCVEID